MTSSTLQAQAARTPRRTEKFSRGHALRGLLGLVVGMSAWWSGNVGAQTFSNTNSNTIPNTIYQQGPASLYPAPLSVTGVGNSLTSLSVTFFNLSHAYPDDLDILLVGPTGQNVMLMSDCGGYFSISGLSLTFSDSAAASLPDETQITGGTYKPTNYDAMGMTDSFAPPAPLVGPYGSTLSAFNGTDPNGTWSLYIIDDTQGNSGTMGGGWSLTLTAINVPEPSTFALGALALAGGGAAYVRRRARRSVQS